MKSCIYKSIGESGNKHRRYLRKRIEPEVCKHVNIDTELEDSMCNLFLIFSETLVFELNGFY